MKLRGNTDLLLYLNCTIKSKTKLKDQFVSSGYILNLFQKFFFLLVNIIWFIVFKTLNQNLSLKVNNAASYFTTQHVGFNESHLMNWVSALSIKQYCGKTRCKNVKIFEELSNFPIALILRMFKFRLWLAQSDMPGVQDMQKDMPVVQDHVFFFEHCYTHHSKQMHCHTLVFCILAFVIDFKIRCSSHEAFDLLQWQKKWIIHNF